VSVPAPSAGRGEFPLHPKPLLQGTPGSSFRPRPPASKLNQAKVSRDAPLDFPRFKTYLLASRIGFARPSRPKTGRRKFCEDTMEPGPDGRRWPERGCSPRVRYLKRLASHVPRHGSRAACVRGPNIGRRPAVKGWEALESARHPSPNPYVPTSHANVRFFRRSRARKRSGLAADSTLLHFNGFADDSVHWHRPRARQSSRSARSSIPGQTRRATIFPS